MSSQLTGKGVAQDSATNQVEKQGEFISKYIGKVCRLFRRSPKKRGHRKLEGSCIKQQQGRDHKKIMQKDMDKGKERCKSWEDTKQVNRIRKSQMMGWRCLLKESGIDIKEQTL
jgi:hypothetical protein